MSKYARCAKCRHFYVVGKLMFLECGACTYRTFRCLKCEGIKGAARSIRVHYSYYRARAGGVGGHEEKP